MENTPGIVSITLVPTDENRSQITLVFSDNPLELKKWVVIDNQGVTTSVSLLSTQRDISLDSKLFKIKLKVPETSLEY